MAAVLHSLVILLVSTLVCYVKSDANVTTPIMRSVHSTKNASSGGSDWFPLDISPSPQPAGVSVCLLTREGADILNITLECRTVPSYQNISWSIKRAMDTSWENLEAISDERFEVSLKQLRISRVTLQDNGLIVRCLNLCTRINDAYTLTYDGQNVSNEKTCPPQVITDANQTDLDQNFNITCFTDTPRQIHPIAFLWVAIGVFALCVCLVGVLCYISSTKQPRGERGERSEQGDTGGEPAAGPSSGDAEAHRTDSLGIVYATPREICSSNTLSRIQTFLSTKRAASTSIGITSSAEGIDATPAVSDQPDQPDSSTVRSKPRVVKSSAKKTAAETSSDDVQAHRRDRLGIIYSAPRDLRKSTTLSRIHTMLSTKRAASTSKADGGIDATPAAVDQPDKPDSSTMRSKPRGVKSSAKKTAAETSSDDVQAHRRDRLGIIYSAPRDLRKSTTLSRIHTLLSTKRAASTSKADGGIDATPAAVDQPDKPEKLTLRPKPRVLKTRVKTISGEGWLDDRPYVNV